MTIEMHATKLVVRDVVATERFYIAVGLKVVSRNVGGEQEVRQKQTWLSATGDRSSHLLILSQFLELPPPSPPLYPGEVWLAFNVSDVEATIKSVTDAGGRTVRAGQDIPDHSVRAAVVSDAEGHFIEIVGPMIGK